MRAGRVPQPRIYGNFKNRGKPAKKPEGEKARNRRPGMSPEHLALVRQLPCVVTGREDNVDAHHLKGVGESGMGLKTTDRWTVPVQHDWHMTRHRQGPNDETWFARFNIDPYELARDLWNATGNLDRMRAIVLEYRRQAGLT